ncbi:hypothetical protein RchiOBHm_Chr1g0370711 [Rosa chinensis]|uniref:Uncharacterized protein n=1 Tax=Rosa chinensis TaxID=74649 RepID=A0A2P6SLE3_ROSCH|nr:hypothetical protein RchiOBHm_Chr1g0370711 [Rosa chinensis]
MLPSVSSFFYCVFTPESDRTIAPTKRKKEEEGNSHHETEQREKRGTGRRRRRGIWVLI